MYERYLNLSIMTFLCVILRKFLICLSHQGRRKSFQGFYGDKLMEEFEKIISLALIFLGIIGICMGFFCYYLAASPEDPEELDSEEDSFSDREGYLCCGTGSLIISIIFMAFGWKLLNDEKKVRYYPNPPRYQNSYYSPPPIKNPTYQYQDNKPVIIQTIGKYVAGDEIEISDSVVQRSRIGGSYPRDDEIEFEDKDFELNNNIMILKEYKKLLENIWEDGEITDYEYKILKLMRKHENISISDHMKIEREVLQEKNESKKRICPECKNYLSYIESYDEWYCYNCEEYID